MAGCTDPEVLPKLEELRARIQSFEEDYESRLAAVQERNQRALENLAKLQDRVSRRASAQAEMEARAEAEKEAAAAEAAAAEAAIAVPKKEKVKAKRRAPLVRLWPAEEPPALPLPEVTTEDMQVMMVAVGLETPAYWQRCQPKVSPSPFVPLPTPECWDDRGSLMVRPLEAA